jgi:membrane-associated phospholipid phosphatase
VSGRLTARLKQFDLRADAALERLRAHRAVAAVFVGASHAADFSILWIVVGGVYGLAVERDLGEALTFCGLIGAESLLVNQGIKRFFRRVRPTERGDDRMRVRKPSTSSFPSGHASSAFFASTLLSAWIGWWSAPLWLVPAVIVAMSRAVVRIHHASDVIAGVVVGLVLAGIVLLTPVVDYLHR